MAQEQGYEAAGNSPEAVNARALQRPARSGSGIPTREGRKLKHLPNGTQAAEELHDGG